MKKVFSRILDELSLPMPKASDVWDVVRAVLLSLFTLAYTVGAVAWSWAMKHWIFEAYPTSGYMLPEYVSIAILAVVYAIVALLLIRSIDHWKRTLRLQLILYACILIPYLIVGYFAFAGAPGWGVLALILTTIAFLPILLTQIAAIALRELVRNKLASRKKERILGGSLLGGFVLLLAVLAVIFPTYDRLGGQLNKHLQDPPADYQVDNFLNHDSVAAVPAEAWPSLLSTLAADVDREELPFEVDYTIMVRLYTDDPDDELYLRWCKQYNCVKISYRGAEYYADATEFRKMILPYIL